MSCLHEAVKKHRSGDLSEAAELYRSAISENPKNADILSLYGLCLQDLGNYELAEDFFTKALRQVPNRENLYESRGTCRLHLGKTNAALQDFESGLKLSPKNLNLVLQAGNAYISLDELSKAVTFFRRAVELSPIDPGSKAGLAYSLSLQGLEAIKQHRFSNAVSDLSEAMKHVPDSWEIGYNLGNAHLKSGSYLEALAAYKATKKLNSQSSDLNCNIGIAYERLGLFDKSIRAYNSALQIEPNNSQALYNKSLILLKMGNYQEGFKLYENRWKVEQFASFRHQSNAALWLGQSDLKNKTILCHAEQGFGDTIQFARFCRLFDHENTKVLIQASQSQLELLKTMDINAEYFSEKVALPSHDFHCPFMSLPHAFNFSYKDTPPIRRYLYPSPQVIRKWKKYFGKVQEPLIGLAFEGKNSHVHDHLRSINPLEIANFLPIGPKYFLLQKELSSRSQKFLELRQDVCNLSEQLSDFMETAGACENLDFIVSVDTSIAHLAGAIGKKTLLMLHYQSDWRWQLNSPKTHWYPSVDIIRLSRNKDWKSAFPAVRNRILERMIGSDTLANNH